MPLSCDCYQGCWGDHSRRWNSLTSTVAVARKQFEHAGKVLPRGTFVLMGNTLRVETSELMSKLQSSPGFPPLYESPNTPEPPPLPNPGEPAVWDLVIADMKERDSNGALKYGQRLTAGDGRNSLIDAYQECLDMAVYLRKAIREQTGK